MTEQRISAADLGRALQVTARAIYKRIQRGALPQPRLDARSDAYWQPIDLALALDENDLALAVRALNFDRQDLLDAAGQLAIGFLMEHRSAKNVHHSLADALRPMIALERDEYSDGVFIERVRTFGSLFISGRLNRISELVTECPTK